MEEGSGGGGVGGEASSSSPIVLCGGGRQRFEVELRPGETTIVSWKKLMKDAEKAAKNNNDSKSSSVSAASVPPVPVSVPVPIAANPALDSRIAPPSGETAENEGNDAPPGSRFSAVIEKIERLYMGKNSSDEEDLNDVPDDDEYDTEDSFIDDAELDDYFQVDNSAIKHDGFFVNRGKLERTNEPTALPTEQPKKRRRKDPTKGINENNIPNKQIKVNKKEGKKLVTSADKNPIVPNVNSEDVKYQSPIIALGTVVKKPSDSKNPSPTRVFQGDAKVTVTAKITDKQKPGILQSKKHVSKLKDGKPSNDVQLKSQGQIGNNSEDLNQSVSLKEKNVVHQQTDNKASEIAQTPQKTVRKEGSSTKPRSTNLVLEKAISDLEKTVAETRPASMEVSEGDNSSQAVKRRMPPEIKQKLAKVARVAHGINGKVSKELLNRLMSIVGHLIQIRSLKRNLENMVVSGLSAKEEKNGKLQQLKKEVDEMVKIRAPLMKPEAGIGSSDDFQEAVKTKFTTDDALEDKICDLYDLFVDGLDEDAGPHQLRKLYVELAELWPKGCMDNHGIKRAICRAKERKKTLFRHKDQEKMKRKKLVAPKPEVNPVSVADSITTVRSISNTLAANITTRPPGPTTEKTKQEKLKGSSSSANNQNNTTVSEVLVKKKTKRKPDAELADGQTRPEKSNKQMTVKPTPVVTTTTTVAPPAQPQPQVVDNSSVDLG